MNRLIQMNKATAVFFVVLGLSCFCLSPVAHAEDGALFPSYRGNTAEGEGALATKGIMSDNTAMGFEALSKNHHGDNNTASGSSALHDNINGNDNTATGVNALRSNITASGNTANGSHALRENMGENNTAIGARALLHNTTGIDNTATGFRALPDNTTGRGNTANGVVALLHNTTGRANTAYGFSALTNNTTGSGNIALGVEAGQNQTTGSDNVYIGLGIPGVAGESNACYIASIFGQTSVNGVPVLINSDRKLGTMTSSARFKRDIHDMDNASEALFALRPVAFRYKEEIDPAGTSQLGLVAEDVEKVNPDLVVRDKEGKPYSVRYDQVNAMLLNEFLKAHRKMEEQGAMIAQQQKQIEALTAGLQKVSAQLELSKPAPQVVKNKE